MTAENPTVSQNGGTDHNIDRGSDRNTDSAPYTTVFRLPTPEELSDLKEFHLRLMVREDSFQTVDMADDEDIEYVEQILGNASIVVFPEYITGGPIFSGKVLILLYDSAPDQVESYVWINDKIVRVMAPES